MLEPDDEIIAVTKEWIEKAESDFQAATILMRARTSRPLESICFHVQQCVEKYLKSLLIINEIEAPRTHNLDVLHDLIPDEVRPLLTRYERNRLTEYAVIPRYPGDYDPITLDETRSAMRVMRRFREEVRRRLPNSVTSGE